MSQLPPPPLSEHVDVEELNDCVYITVTCCNRCLTLGGPQWTLYSLIHVFLPLLPVPVKSSASPKNPSEAANSLDWSPDGSSQLAKRVSIAFCHVMSTSREMTHDASRSSRLACRVVKFG